MKFSSQMKRWGSAAVSAWMLALGAGCGVQAEQQEAAAPESFIKVGASEEALLAGYAVSTNASSYYTGGSITVYWHAPANHVTSDWVSVYAVGAPNSNYNSWASVPAGTSGTLTLTAPSTTGTYQVRYIYYGTDSSYQTAAVSNSFSVVTAPPPGYYICRNLRSGDPYYPGWVYCCDNSERTQSYWIASGATTGSWYGNSCYGYGLR
jgi:hypothetical protein